MGFYTESFRNLSYVAIFRISTRALTLLKTVILARLLSPSQFGLFGIATLVLSLLEVLSETGINVFLIQRKDDINEYIPAAWVVSILRGILLCVLIIVFSPFIVIFFNAPDAFPLLLTISIVPLIRGFINPSIIKLQKNLQFDYEVLLRSSLFIIDVCSGLLMTFLLKDPIGLLWGFIISAVCEVTFSWIFIKPIPHLQFDLQKIRIIFRHGKWVTLFGIFNYFAQEGDTIVVGRLLNTSVLGIYQMGYKISTLPISEFGDVVSKVAFPTYAKIRSDVEGLRKAFIQSLLLIAVPSFLLALIIFLFPNQIVSLLLGEKWLGVIAILPILAIYGCLRAIFGFAATLFLAVERQDIAAGMTFLRFSGLAITIIPLTYYFGIVGTSIAALLSVLIEIPFVCYWLYFVLRLPSERKIQ